MSNDENLSDFERRRKLKEEADPVKLAEKYKRELDKALKQIIALKEKLKKPKTSVIHDNIVRSFLWEDKTYLAHPDIHIGAYPDDKGRHVLYSVGDEEVCTSLSLEVLCSHVAKFCYNNCVHLPDYMLLNPGIESVTGLIKKRIDAYKEPAPEILMLKGETGRCFSRLSFDLVDGPTPLCDEFFNRTTNRTAIKCLIGLMLRRCSKTGKKYKTDQAIMLIGEGNDGKSSLLTSIYNALGTAAVSQDALPDPANKHRWVPYLNKLAAFYTDLESESNFLSSIFKLLASKDPVFIDPKGEPGWNEFLNLFVFIAMNGYPSKISSSRNFKRRAIIGMVSKRDESVRDDFFESRIDAEMPFFLYKCKALSELHYPNGGTVNMFEGEDENGEVSGLIDSAEERLEADFRKHFEIDPSSYVVPNQVQARLAMLYGRGKPSETSITRMKAYMLTKYGVASRSSKNTAEMPGVSKYVYWGIKLVPLDEERPRYIGYTQNFRAY